MIVVKNKRSVYLSPSFLPNVALPLSQEPTWCHAGVVLPDDFPQKNNCILLHGCSKNIWTEKFGQIVNNYVVRKGIYQGGW